MAPIIRLKDISEMTVEARDQKLIDLRAELARIRTMVNAGGAVENPTRIRQLRRTIAQILTIQNEQKLGVRKAAEHEKKAEKPAKKAAAPKKKTEEKTSQ